MINVSDRMPYWVRDGEVASSFLVGRTQDLADPAVGLRDPRLEAPQSRQEVVDRGVHERHAFGD